MVRFLPSIAIALAVILEAGCSERLGFDPIVECSDSQTVTVQVTTRVTPRFNWKQASGMASLQVFLDSGGAGRCIVYSGSAAPQNPLPSGIRYGQLPPKGLAPGGAQPLISGVSYSVVVYRWVGAAGGPGSLFERGSATFTR